MKKRFYKPTGVRLVLNASGVKAWRRLAEVAKAAGEGSPDWHALRVAFDACERLSPIGTDTATNDCVLLRNIVRAAVVMPLKPWKPQEMAWYADRVAEACQGESFKAAS